MQFILNFIQKNRRSLLLSLWFISTLACLTPNRITEHFNSIEILLQPTKFDGSHAATFMRELSHQFPNRTTWSTTRKDAALWLKSKLKALGLPPEGQTFNEIINGHSYSNLENVFAIKEGSELPNEILALVAHYDIAENTIEGAMDDASGVGIVLELARVLAQERTRRTLLFLLTDSEEFGTFWGAKAFVSSSVLKHGAVRTALNFDFVAPHKQIQILTLGDSATREHAPLWLRELSSKAITTELPSTETKGFEEFLLRAIRLPAADHAEFLEAKIPSVTWVGVNESLPNTMKTYHHTPKDEVGIMEELSLSQQGRAAERFIRMLDNLPSIPVSNQQDFKFSEHFSIPTWRITLLACILFLPLFFSSTPYSFFPTLLFTAPFLIAYGFLRLAPWFGLIPQYERFPATEKSLLLYQTPWPLLVCFIFILLAGFSILKKWKSQALTPAAIVCAFRLSSLLLIFQNPFAAILFLWLPAVLVSNPRLNRPLILLGAVPWALCMSYLSGYFDVGYPHVYFLLGSAYGLFTPIASLVTLVTTGALVTQLSRPAHKPL